MSPQRDLIASFLQHHINGTGNSFVDSFDINIFCFNISILHIWRAYTEASVYTRFTALLCCGS